MILKGKAGIVTGAASGMGRETALMFAGEGAAVACADFDRPGAVKVAREIAEAGGHAFGCGVNVVDTSQLDLEHGEVSGAAIGACVQSEGYDTMRLSRDVSYHDNGVNLQATTLPLPQLVELGTMMP